MNKYIPFGTFREYVFHGIIVSNLKGDVRLDFLTSFVPIIVVVGLLIWVVLYLYKTFVKNR
jgi:hypothetical protein